MTKPNSTLIVAILDRSGSMAGIADDMIGGFNSFLADQKARLGETKMTLVRFDHEYEVVHELSNIREVTPLDRYSFAPRGNTALYDAVCRTIDSVGDRLAALPETERPAKVLVMIVTDGCENASTVFRAESVRGRIKDQKEKYQWEFMFLGANQDSFATAESLGILRSATMNYAPSSKGIQAMFCAASVNAAQYASGATANMSFSAEQRDAAMTE